MDAEVVSEDLEKQQAMDSEQSTNPEEEDAGAANSEEQNNIERPSVSPDAPKQQGMDEVAEQAAHQADFVYFDPPWGGPDYYKQERLVLRLDDISVGTLIGQCLGRNAPTIVYKAPVNIDREELKESISLALNHENWTWETHPIRKGYYNIKGDISYELHFFRQAAQPNK